MKSLMVSVLTLLAVSATSTQSRQAVPDLTLRVGVRQKEDGKLDKGIHILTLQCRDGQCSLTSVSVNQTIGSRQRKQEPDKKGWNTSCQPHCWE